ncbi:MAG TPA: hypothetical protein VGE96_00875 [Steroidobacteraceae bacterium]
MNAPLVLPDVCHVKRVDAHAIAQALVKLFSFGDISRLSLYIYPTGAVMYEMNEPTGGNNNHALCGVYTAQSTEQQIIEDILAMEREPIAP